MEDAPKIIGPMMSISLTLDVAFVCLMVLKNVIKLASIVYLWSKLDDLYGIKAL